MSNTPFGPLREAVNVDDLKARDSIIRRIRRARKMVEQNKADIEHWNRLHPDEPPLDALFEDAILAWYDGKGPMPDELVKRLPPHLRPGFHDVL